jgi:hypothetical protein
MKSFRQLYSEVAEPKPEEEKKFKAQHAVDAVDHPVSTEFQHKGVMKPKAKRKADQEGDANYDKAYVVKEEAEQLDEIGDTSAGKKKLKNLIVNRTQKVVDAGASIERRPEKAAEYDKAQKRHMKTIGRAATRLAKEEVEQLDELSPNTLHKYVKKASGNLAGNSAANAAIAAVQVDKPKSQKADRKDLVRNMRNRMRGISSASGRLADKANMAEDASEEKPMMSKQLDFIAYAAKEIKDYIAKSSDPEEWYQNKLTAAHEAMKTLHANIGDHEADDMDESLEEGVIGGVLGGMAGMMAGTATGATSAASKFAGNLAAKAGKNMIQRGAYRAMGNAAGAAAPALAGAVVGSKAQDAITGKKKNEELVGGQKKLDHNKNGKIDAHDFKLMKSKKNEEVELDEGHSEWHVTFKSDGHKPQKVKARNTSEAIRKASKAAQKAHARNPHQIPVHKDVKKVTESVEQIDEISQETLRNYHGKAGADLQAKRKKLEKGTLTSKDYKQGRNRAAGLNRAANKMEEVELDEAFSQGILKFKDRSQTILKKEDADALNKMFKGMSSTNRKKMTEDAMTSKKSFEEILGFAREA